jgi:hypothetical protein
MARNPYPLSTEEIDGPTAVHMPDSTPIRSLALKLLAQPLLSDELIEIGNGCAQFLPEGNRQTPIKEAMRFTNVGPPLAPR